MKKNIYTDGISRIKASDELIKKGIENIRGSEVREEIINLNSAKAKRKWIKPLGAIAASLAIVIGLGSVSIFGRDESVKNPFILTANAEELNNDTYIQVGKIECQGNGGAMRFENGSFKLQEIGANFDFNIECVGENIESVTYSADNACLYIKGDYEGVIDYEALTMEQLMDGKDINTHRSGYKRVNACTFDYDMQPQGDTKGINSGEYQEEIPLCGSFLIEDFIGVYEFDSTSRDFDVRDIFIDEFNKSAENFTVDVTANYTDGSTLTKTMQFQCQKTEDGNDICLSAMIV
ncbi:MAG: hypothetical protein UHK60_06495 [Acutalibacteraceae bacterium]|nr:hypothetical protein [Acutalibacteraceae bacterium]